jgi:TPR repeat protein
MIASIVQRLKSSILRNRASPSVRFDAALNEISKLESGFKEQGSVSTPALPNIIPNFQGLSIQSMAKMQIDDLKKLTLSGPRCFILGKMLFNGYTNDQSNKKNSSTIVIAKDVDKATQIWLHGATLGDVNCLFTSACCSIEGVGKAPKNIDLAIGLLRSLADVGFAEASYTLAMLFIKQEKEAWQHLLAIGNISLEMIPIEGRKTEKFAEARNLLLEAAKANVIRSYLNLSRMLLLGIGGDINEVEAEKWLQAGAVRGDAICASLLASRYAIEGRSSEESKTKNPNALSLSHKLWRVAAEAGDPIAALNVGIAFHTGWAISWEIEAKELMKNGKAETSLQPGQPDPLNALVWYERASRSGVVQAMVNAGQLLEYGMRKGDVNIEAGREPMSQLRPDVQKAMQHYKSALSTLKKKIIGLSDSDPLYNQFSKTIDLLQLWIKNGSSKSHPMTLKADIQNQIITGEVGVEREEESVLSNINRKN